MLGAAYDWPPADLEAVRRPKILKLGDVARSA
jgi:hypothetical protein